MNSLIKKIKENTILTILIALCLGVFIILTSGYLARWTTPLVEKYVNLSFYTQNTIGKLYMLMLSIVLIWFINNKSFSNYGFTKAKNIRYSKMILITIGIAILSFIIGNILFNGVLAHLFPTDNTKTFSKPNSILEMILTVWIWSTFVEEIMVRGLMQGFMSHLNKKILWKLSLSVIISGLFFGAMHLTLLKAGMGVWFVSFIVFNTTVIGLLAAYYREKSGSLFPPILIHFLANVVGSIPFIIITLLDIKIPNM